MSIPSSLIHEPRRPRKPWRVKWREDGRQRTKRFGTKSEAVTFQAQLARGGPRVATADMTVREWLLHWMRTYGHEWEERTIRDRTRICRLHVAPGVGHLRLGELSRADIRAWRTAMIEAGRTPKVANDAVRVLSAALGRAEEEDVIVLNPCRGLRRLPEPRVHRQPFTLDEIEAVRLELERPQDRAVVSLMAYAGLRPAEVRGLCWEDVREHTIRVHRSLTPSGRLKSTKSGGERSVPLLAPVAADLRSLPRGGPDDLVIDLGMDWDSWTEDHFRPARARAGVSKPPYALRHSYASLLIAEGRTIQEVAYLLGHASTDLTHRTYGHLFAEAQFADGQDMAAAAVAARERAPRLRAHRDASRSDRPTAVNSSSGSAARGGGGGSRRAVVGS